MQRSSAHRHFVAAPAFLLVLLAVSVFHLVLPVRAEILGTSIQGRTLSSMDSPLTAELPNGTQLTLDPASAVRIDDEGNALKLLRGGVVIRSERTAVLTVGEVRSTFFASEVYAIVDASSSSILPLSGPVLVSDSGHSLVIVPGEQYRRTASGERGMTLVPASWFQNFPHALDTVSMSDAPPSGPAVASLLASARASDEALWIAALSLLPRVSPSDAEGQRAILGALKGSAISDEAYRAVPRLLLHRPFQVSDDVVAAWNDSVVRLAARSGTDASAYLVRIAEVPRMLTDAGYPKQAQMWDHALTTAHSLTLSVLSPPEQMQLREALTRSGDRPLAPAREITNASVPASRDAHTTSPQLLLQETRTMLERYGAMVTPKTRVTVDPNDAESVRITEIFLPENGQDVRYNCVYTPATNLISHIDREGELLPNSLTPEQFFH